MPGELREELQAAFNELSAQEEQSQNKSAEQQADDGKPADAGRTAERARGEDGRFAPRTPAKDTLPPDQEQAAEVGQEKPAATPDPAPAQQQATQALRAPVSWTPEERQGWEQMSPAHQQAVLRREQEINRTLAQTAEARRFAAEVQQVLQPYLGMIEAEGGTPVTAIQEVMRTAAALRTAPPLQKAAAVADLVIQFGIDPHQLDAALTSRFQGRPAPNDPLAPVMQALDQRLKPVTDFMSTFQQRQQQMQMKTQQEAEAALSEFMNDPKNEFAADVADEMADILEMAARRGVQMSLQDAYSRATMLHPSISKILEGRRSAQGAAQQTAAAQRARNAAVSVPGSGAPSVSSGDEDVGDDVRSAIGAAIKQHSGRR